MGSLKAKARIGGIIYESNRERHHPCFEAIFKRDLLSEDMPYAAEIVMAAVGIRCTKVTFAIIRPPFTDLS